MSREDAGEWRETIRFKSYLGHPQVPRQPSCDSDVPGNEHIRGGGGWGGNEAR